MLQIKHRAHNVARPPQVCDRCEHWAACEGEPFGPELLAAACWAYIYIDKVVIVVVVVGVIVVVVVVVAMLIVEHVSSTREQKCSALELTYSCKH